MEGKASDWRPGPTVCRCCLTEGCYKDISTEYFWMGKREVYAEMLSETLNVSIAYSQSGGPNSNSRLICEPCISRLRDASEFKRQVIDCEKTFMHHLDPGSSSKSREFTVDSIGEVKVEVVKREKESLSDDDFDDRPDFLDVDTDDDLDDQPLTKLASKMPSKVPKKEVDLLDLLDSSQITVKRKSNLKLKAPPKKVVKKKEVVKPAAVKVATPSKQVEKKKENQEHTKRNAEIVLKYTTLYPFRLRGNTFICVYCCDEFEDPDIYRCHMDETHQTVNLYTAFAHTSKCRSRDYLKVDCVNLKCKLCGNGKFFESVADVAKHLVDMHDENADIVRSMNLNYEVGLHPYRLIKDKWICMVCNMKLPTLIKLTRHMSSHYADYVCDICGRSYLNSDNLKYHVKFSHTEKNLCRKCKKEFPTPEERKQHLRTSSKCWTFACVHCGDRFSSWELKQKHLVSQHNVQAATYPCPDCEVVFNSRKRFYDHYSTTHTDLAFVCSCCGKKFRNKGLLDDHLVIHTGEKQHQCTKCLKSFTRKKALMQHLWTHSETKRFSCLMCDRAFNQKVCLKSHMKNVHPDVPTQF